MCKIPHIKLIAIAATLFALCGGGRLQAQGTGVCGSDPSPAMECGEYQWPLGVIRPCPNVVIKQKGNHYYDDDKQGDHTTTARYRHKGWDTVVSCEHPQIVLSSTPYIPVQRFNGTYYVDQIPYNPPDTTFSQGTRMPIGTDDVFANDHTIIPYAFYFFGIRKNQFRIGANGLVTFCSPTEFSIPDGVSAILGVGFPKRAWAVVPFRLMEPRMSRSYIGANSYPNANVRLGGPHGPLQPGEDEGRHLRRDGGHTPGPVCGQQHQPH